MKVPLPHLAGGAVVMGSEPQTDTEKDLQAGSCEPTPGNGNWCWRIWRWLSAFSGAAGGLAVQADRHGAAPGQGPSKPRASKSQSQPGSLGLLAASAWKGQVGRPTERRLAKPSGQRAPTAHDLADGSVADLEACEELAASARDVQVHAVKASGYSSQVHDGGFLYLLSRHRAPWLRSPGRSLKSSSPRRSRRPDRRRERARDPACC